MMGWDWECGRTDAGGRFTGRGKKDDQVFVSTSFFLGVEKRYTNNTDLFYSSNSGHKNHLTG
jgi:hypothetical protein